MTTVVSKSYVFLSIGVAWYYYLSVPESQKVHCVLHIPMKVQYLGTWQQ